MQCCGRRLRAEGAGPVAAEAAVVTAVAVAEGMAAT